MDPYSSLDIYLKDLPVFFLEILFRPSGCVVFFSALLGLVAVGSVLRCFGAVRFPGCFSRFVFLSRLSGFSLLCSLASCIFLS